MPSNQFLSDWPQLMLVMALLLNLLILVTFSSGETNAERKIRDRQHTFHDGEHNPHYDHETILGNRKEAEMFDKLSPEDSKNRLRVLAKKMDKDDDGFIDKKELGSWLSRSMKMLNRDDAEESFKEYDTNHNRFIEWKEYLAFELDNLGADGDEPAKTATQNKDLLDEDKAFFDAADTDKDGKLDINEYQSFAHPDDHLDKMAMVTLNMVHKIQDANKDGKIDFDEYLKNRSKDRDVEWFKKEKKLFQSTLDKNGDGTLDKQEIIDWLASEEEDPEEDPTDHLISAADDNRDGKLSMEEIVGHHKVFVGSEVTNYGDDLGRVERFKDEL